MAESKREFRRCFIVGPIGDDTSEDRIHADWLLEMIIRPVFEANFEDFRVERADMISIPGRIDAQVISALLEADLVIADLSTLNPNAFYEIGIRHMTQKPVIHMHLEGQKIPFDIATFRSIKFSRERPSDLRAAQALLKDAVKAAIDPSHSVDNPVTFARGKIHFDKDATPSERMLQDQIDDIRSKIEAMSNNNLIKLGPISEPPANRAEEMFYNIIVEKNRGPQVIKMLAAKGNLDFELVTNRIGNKEDTIVISVRGYGNHNEVNRFMELLLNIPHVRKVERTFR